MESINQITLNNVNPIDKPVTSLFQTKAVGRVAKQDLSVSQTGAKTKESDAAGGVNFSKLVDKISSYVESISTKVSFSYDEKTSKPVIKVTDKETGEVIRQIPEKEMLDLLYKLEYIAGLIYHKQA